MPTDPTTLDAVLSHVHPADVLADVLAALSGPVRLAAGPRYNDRCIGVTDAGAVIVVAYVADAGTHTDRGSRVVTLARDEHGRITVAADVRVARPEPIAAARGMVAHDLLGRAPVRASRRLASDVSTFCKLPGAAS